MIIRTARLVRRLGGESSEGDDDKDAHLSTFRWRFRVGKDQVADIVNG